MRRRAFTLVELLVAGLCVSILLAATLQGFISLQNAFSGTMSQSSAQGAAGEAVRTITASIRRAPACTKKHGCGSEDGSAVASAAAKDITINGGSSGKDLRFWEENGNVYRSGPGGTDLLAENASLDLTYYAASKRNADDLVPISPDASTLPRIIAVDVAVTSREGKGSGTYQSTVRLRNSPVDTDSY